MAAVLVGTSIFAAGGFPAAALLLAFFISSSLLSRLQQRRDHEPRNALQVLANGGVAAGCIILANRYGMAWQTAFVGALAAATADTWGTEIGTRFGGTPRSVVGGQPLARGLSGGMTVFGTLAEVVAAICIASLAYILSGRPFVVVSIAGIAGALSDSLFGATVQARYRCRTCSDDCETPIHACGQRAALVRGAYWVTNDMVNLLATLIGAGTALLLARAF